MDSRQLHRAHTFSYAEQALPFDRLNALFKS